MTPLHTPPVAGLSVLVALASSGAGAQQVVEIDTLAGRTIIDSELRSLSTSVMAVDWQRDVIHLDDDETPDGVMAFSLETGEPLRTIHTPKGEGPFEFSYGRQGVSLSPRGGLYVSGSLRVVEYDMGGSPVWTWTPLRIHPSGQVCTFGGLAAVPASGGVVRRLPDGTNENIGPVRESPFDLALNRARIACTEDRAYVVKVYETGPDSVFTYGLDGVETPFPLPEEGDRGEDCRRTGSVLGGMPGTVEEGCAVWSRKLDPSFDDRGNLVLFGTSGLDFHGVVVNPSTGCYALVRKVTADNRFQPIAVKADSALVLENASFPYEYEGKVITAVNMGSANRLSMLPLRRISGDSCPGLL